MQNISYVKKQVITAVCIAFCVVLPMAFHAIPNAGSIFSPMHIPVLLCGLVCGWPYGLLCGLIGPLLSGIILQMPPMAVLPSMMIELAVYGLVSGLLMRLVHTGRAYVNLYISLIVSMLVGRIAAGIAQALIFNLGQYSVTVWVTSYFVTAWPGLVLQIVLIPTIVAALKKAKLIGIRDSEQGESCGSR